MDGMNLRHIRQHPSSPTLPPSSPTIPPLPGLNDTTGDPGLVDHFNNGLFSLDPGISAQAAEDHGKADSVADDGTGYNATRQRFSESKRYSIDELTAYDLHPPPPTATDANAEYLASRLFSPEHLDLILQDTQYSQRFRSFLTKYRPDTATTLTRYLESKKALAAIRYANALAEKVSSTRSPDPQRLSRSSPVRSDAVVVDTQFQRFSQKAVDELVNEALPAYVTYQMVRLVTECLVKDITGSNSPIMRDLISGLAEVYCMSDPNQPDNPLVFASEGFYSTTQYSPEYVIGRNCRFLQGPCTSKSAIERISNAIRSGKEINELLLNYRRDGDPFLNLVMTAPLMDQHGHVRYYLGAQIDITRLLEGGKGLDSLKQLLDQEREANMRAAALASPDKRPSLKILGELGGLLDNEEADIMREHSARLRSGSNSSSASATARAPPGGGRRFIGMEDTVDDKMWSLAKFGSDGRLPGVYQNYLLVRPFPSLRITFTSPALRIPGLSQAKLMDRIGGPQYIRDGLVDALAQGVSVTAKVSWLTRSSRSSGHSDASSIASEDSTLPTESRPRWIHCTPLMGSDLKPGVYMIVMVDKEQITGTLNSHQATIPIVRGRDHTKETWPFRAMRDSGNSAAGFSSAKLYNEYLRREGAISGSSESFYTRRRTPNLNRTSLEEDLQPGRAHSDIGRSNPRTGTPLSYERSPTRQSLQAGNVNIAEEPVRFHYQYPYDRHLHEGN